VTSLTQQGKGTSGDVLVHPHQQKGPSEQKHPPALIARWATG